MMDLSDYYLIIGFLVGFIVSFIVFSVLYYSTRIKEYRHDFMKKLPEKHLKEYLSFLQKF